MLSSDLISKIIPAAVTVKTAAGYFYAVFTIIMPSLSKTWAERIRICLCCAFL